MMKRQKQGELMNAEAVYHFLFKGKFGVVMMLCIED